MNRSGWIVQLLPEDGGRPRSVRLSSRSVRLLGAACALLVLLAGATVFLSVRHGHRAAELATLREENRELESRVESADETLESLATTLDRVAAEQGRFRLLAGLPLVDEEVQQVGVGGPGPSEVRRADGGAGTSELDRLVRRADLLHASLREATDSMAAHRDLFLSRPSIRPVPPELSWVSSSFSRSRYHPVLQYNRPHEGVDVSAPAGAPIVATARGRVTHAGRRAGYGNVVEIDHGNGYSTLYAHAAKIEVRRGQRVERGQVIGRVGETGLTSGPNVHYEVHVKGQPVNPYFHFLSDRVFQ